MKKLNEYLKESLLVDSLFSWSGSFKGETTTRNHLLFGIVRKKYAVVVDYSKFVDTLSEVDIPSSIEYDGKTYKVTAIEERAFRDCKTLKSINIPKSVTKIGDHAFYDCENLKMINIPDSVKSIGDCSFSGCNKLESIIVPSSVTKIGTQVFARCFNLESIVLPERFKSMLTPKDLYFFCPDESKIEWR